MTTQQFADDRSSLVDEVHGARGHVTAWDLLFVALYVLVGSFWAYQTTRMFSVWIVLFHASLVVTSLLWGRVVLVYAGVDRYLVRSAAFCFLVGCLGQSFVLAVLKIVTPVRLEHLFGLFSVLGMGLYWRNRNWIAAWRPALDESRFGLAAAFLMLVSTALWNQHLSPLFIDRGDYYQFDFFNENFSNACNTMPLTVDGLPSRGGSFQFAGESLSFYHWGSYTFTALARPLAGISILPGQAAVWYPLGQVLLGLAAYALGSFWFRPSVGFWCAACTMVLPDPTYWSSDVYCLSFLRVLEASSNMLYSEAGAAVTLILSTLGARHASSRSLAAGILAAFATAYFKVNVILMLWPVVLLVMWMASDNPRPRKVKWAVVIFSLLVATAYGLGMQVRSAPTFAMDPQFGRAYVEWVSEHSAGGSWIAEGMRSAAEQPDRFWMALPRAGWIVLGTLQWWLLPWALVLLWRLRRPLAAGLTPYIPLFTVLLYGFWAVMLVPNTNGDPFELQHRAFGWAYLLVVVWTSGEIASALGRWFKGLAGDGLLLGYALLAIPLTVGRDYRVPHPEQLMAKGYYACLEYARTQTDPNDWFVDSRKDPWLMTVGMAERRTFMCFARPFYNFPGHGSLAKVHSDRSEEIERLLSLEDAASIREWGRKHGIRWCILHPDTQASWPEEVLDRAHFQSGEHRLIDLTQP